MAAITLKPYSGKDAGYSIVKHAKDKSYILTFEHMPTGHKVSFPAIIQSFSDSHDAQSSEKLYANNNNPQITQGSTNRRISLTFKVLSASVDESRYNEQSINLLLQMMYPSLTELNVADYDPYIRISGFNLLQDGSTNGGVECVIQNITYTLDLNEGIIAPEAGEIHMACIVITVDGIALLPINLQQGQNQPYPRKYPRYR